METSLKRSAAPVTLTVRSWLIVLACVVATPAAAFAHPARVYERAGSNDVSSGGDAPKENSATRLSARLMLGFGGDAELSFADGPTFPSEMLTTYGLGLGLEAPIHPNISLGAFVEFAQWNMDAIDELDGGRSTMWDLMLFPKLRYPVVTRDHVLELYAGPVIGASHNSLDDSATFSGSEQSTFGLAVGAFAGVAYSIAPGVGLSFELGYQHRSFSFSGENTFELSFGQFGMNAGVLVAL